MTPKQLLQRVQTELKAMVWGVTANKVFGDSVYITPEVPIQQLALYQSPTAFIIDQGAPCDGEHPGILYQSFSVTIFVENYQCAKGEGAMVGAIRTANTSQGAGILDIEDEFLSKVIEIITMTTKAMLVEKNVPKAQIVGGNNFPAVLRAFNFTAITSIY